MVRTRSSERIQLTLLLLTLAVAWCPPVRAQAPTPNSSEALRVGVAPLEPLVITKGDGVYDGLAVQLWKATAARTGTPFRYVPLESASATEALDSGRVDVVLTATPPSGLLDTLPHGPIYFSSSLAVTTANTSPLAGVLAGFFQPAFFKILAGLSVLLLAVGTIIYLVERKRNAEQFGGKVYEGIGAGFWWAGVTLTTIGYGDKAPVSFAGRLVAMLWMIVGLAVSATLTAAIVSLADTGGGDAVTLPNDLDGARNLVVEDSALEEYFGARGVDYVTVPDLEEAVRRLEADEADHLLSKEFEIRHFLEQRDADVSVQSTRYQPAYFAVGFGRDLAQADTLNAAMLEVLGSPAWGDWLGTYVPRY